LSLAFFDVFRALCHFFLSTNSKADLAILKSLLDNISELIAALSIFFFTIRGFFSG